MPAPKKKINKRSLKKRDNVVIIRTEISPKDTLFPEKLAKANEILRNCKNL